MANPASLPHIHLLCMLGNEADVFEKALAGFDPSLSELFTIYRSDLASLPASVQFDTIVSPANSYGRLDGGFDDAISRAFSPKDDYLALTRAAQAVLYEEWHGFAPPGTCILVQMPREFEERSNNVWGTQYLALCPTMRIPQDVRWDREVVYECVWSLLCAIDRHNKAIREGKAPGDTKIGNILMSPLATATGKVAPERWASQFLLAIKHFIDSTENPEEWSALEAVDILGYSREVART
jgi:O-acetyl-ADP-ribose deacetylase (regulator of RNase III)